jgi:hypothetical protein
VTNDRLPAITEATEREAIETVSGWLARFPALSTVATREWLMRTLIDLVTRDAIDIDLVITAAKAGDEIADAALLRVFRDTLDRGEMPPARLRVYGMDATKRGPVRRRRGRSAFDNLRRDIATSVLVFLTHARFGFQIMREQEKKPGRDQGPTACAVVAAALRRAGVAVSEKRVMNIWSGLAGQFAVYAAQNLELVQGGDGSFRLDIRSAPR